MIPDYDACLKQLRQRRKQQWITLGLYDWLRRYDRAYDDYGSSSGRLKFIKETAVNKQSEYHQRLWAAYISDRLRGLVK